MHQAGECFGYIAAVFSATAWHVHLLIPTQHGFSMGEVGHFRDDLFKLSEFFFHISS